MSEWLQRSQTVMNASSPCVLAKWDCCQSVFFTRKWLEKSESVEACKKLLGVMMSGCQAQIIQWKQKFLQPEIADCYSWGGGHTSK